MKTPRFNPGDGVLFNGEVCVVESFDPRKTTSRFEYILRDSEGELTWAEERDLEPVELNYED